MNTQKWRKETLGCEVYTHLNNAGASMPPHIVTDTICRYIQQEAVRGGYEIHEMMQSEIDGFYRSTAQLLNGKARNIAFVNSATDGFGRAINSIPFEKGDVILTSNEDYYSNQMTYLVLKERAGVELVRVSSVKTGEIDLEAMEKAIQLHRPKLVSISHIPTNSGLVQPVEAIGDLCKKHDILYLVDACQSAGQMVLDVQKMKCDFLMSAYRKWMRGPRGAGFLFVSDKILDLKYTPTTLDGSAASWTAPNKYELVDSALRFQFWELNYGVLLGAKAATDYALNIGLDHIENRVQELASYTRKQLSSLPNITVQDNGIKKCGIVTASFQGIPQSNIKSALNQHHINCSFATKGHAVIDMNKKGIDWALRISPHYYNTEGEIDKVVSVLSNLIVSE